jgi:hypothetical protein
VHAFNIFFNAKIAAAAMLDFPNNSGLSPFGGTLVQHARACTLLRNYLKRRDNSPFQAVTLNIHSSDVAYISCSSVTISILLIFAPVSLRSVFMANLSLTFFPDHSHVIQTTGSVVGITNT